MIQLSALNAFRNGLDRFLLASLDCTGFTFLLLELVGVAFFRCIADIYTLVFDDSMIAARSFEGAG
jgi:hypothetical protein